ncbi:hypothetical protein [Acinetobacter oleivorans]|uniref:hypothetical protein n=1 Tax=Acinetobacter oleivorans TaxID=1148157 RepID=UPI0012503938|nr:hypothetical protein [Acinetobacter oleivorans]
MSKQSRELYLRGFDLGLIDECSQLRTTLQMRELAVKAHKKHLAEIDDWIGNQSRNLKRRIEEVEAKGASHE